MEDKIGDAYLLFPMAKGIWDAVTTKDENIGNHGCIGTLILRIYWRYINRYFGKKFWLTKN